MSLSIFKAIILTSSKVISKININVNLIKKFNEDIGT